MQDHTGFSPETLRTLTRLSRQIQQLDGCRPQLADKDSVLALIQSAINDQRSEISALANELTSHLKDTERAYLCSNGIDISPREDVAVGVGDEPASSPNQRLYPGNPVANNGGNEAARHRKQRVYRGQVIDDSGFGQDSGASKPRVYRGRVIDE